MEIASQCKYSLQKLILLMVYIVLNVIKVLINESKGNFSLNQFDTSSEIALLTGRTGNCLNLRIHAELYCIMLSWKLILRIKSKA